MSRAISGGTSKIQAQSRVFTAPKDIRDIEEVLPELVVGGRHMLVAESNLRERIKAIKQKEGSRGVGRQACERGCVRPVRLPDPPQVEVVQAILWVSDDLIRIEVQVGIRWESSWDANVQGQALQRPVVVT